MSRKHKHQAPQVKPAAPAPQTHSPNVPHDDKARAVAAIEAVETARGGTRAIVYWLTDTARISEAAVVPLYDQLSGMGKQPAIDLILFTRGGDTEVPWRMVSLLREYCNHLAVLIPHRAQSAGTLLALGADEIVMTPLATLGPIDPSRTHPLLPRREGAEQAEPISVQDMRHAMQFIREAGAAGNVVPYTPEALADIFAALFEKVHPLAIGAIEQSYALAKLVATQALHTHMDPQTEQTQIKAIVDKLCDEYKSHAYQISRREAKAIGLKVTDAPPAVEQALVELGKLYVARQVSPATLPSPRQNFTTHIAWLDSTHLNMRVEAVLLMEQDGKARLLADQWKNY